MNDKVIGSIILEGASTVEDAIITKETHNRLIAEGTLQDMDNENRNRRIYAEEDMKPEINGPRMQELIKAKQFFGEAGHPLSDDLVRQQTIDPKLAAVSYLKVWTEGKLIKGQFKGSNGQYGQQFNDDLRDGCKPAFSLRALGSIENVNGKAYVKGIKIITWDYVVYPSHKAAYTSKLITESAMDGTPIYENQIIVPENDPGRIYNITGSDAKEVISRLQRESANVSMIMETFEGLYDRVDLINEHTIQLTSRYGETMSVNLEKHINNIIMDYVLKM